MATVTAPWCAAELAAFWTQQKPVLVYEPRPVRKADTFMLGGAHIRPVTSIEELRKEVRECKPVISAEKPRIEDTIVKTFEIVQRLDDRFRVSPFDLTNLFGTRFGHFRDEKQAIAAKAAEIIGELLQRHHDKKVRLILDSGTTVYPLFEQIARHRLEALWNQVFLVTNNIPGMLTLMKSAREGDDRHAPLAFRTHVTPGQLAPVYWAVLPDKEADADAFFGPWSDGVTIGVTTSNYLKFDATEMFVRHRGHVEVKKWIVERSDELILLFPLGKILDITTAGLNEHAVERRHHGPNGDPDRQYDSVKLVRRPESSQRFVTTERKDGDLLWRHYTRWLGAVADLTVAYAPFSIRDCAGHSAADQERVEVPHLLELQSDSARRAMRRALHLPLPPEAPRNKEGTVE